MKNLIYPVILAGGKGTRLWPLSREKSPKQFIPIINGRSLFQETCNRFRNKEKFPFLTIITNEDHRFIVKNQLHSIGIYDAIIITEPTAKNTLPACLSSVFILEKKLGNVPIIFSPADHIVKNEHVLYDQIINTYSFVKNGSICLFGIKPETIHTGYGYITKGKKLSDDIYIPSSFIEKPQKDKAEYLIKEGALWNSGLYFCTASTLIKEIQKYEKETHAILQNIKTLEKNKYDFYAIPKNIYEKIPPLSIDKSIAEKTSANIVAETNIIWSDLGSWQSLHNHSEKDINGNTLKGDTFVLQTNNSYIESTDRLVTVYGLNNVGIIETPDAVLVFPINKSESVKEIVETLSINKRDELKIHTKVERPWGEYQILGKDKNFQSKKIVVFPGGELSLQRHKKRAEHWVVIQGVATVTKDNETFELKINESTFIPVGTIHRLQNKHNEVLQLIEVQTGSYFGEDDIERFEDNYGR